MIRLFVSSLVISLCRWLIIFFYAGYGLLFLMGNSHGISFLAGILIWLVVLILLIIYSGKLSIKIASKYSRAGA